MSAAATALDPWRLRPMPAELRPRYLKEGWWDDRTLGAMLLGWLGAHPEVDFRIWSKTNPQKSTFGAVRELALRLAAGLQRRGIGPGDAVCVFVPNSVEGALGFLGVPAVGAAVVPVAPFYGLKELSFILKHSGARLLITAEAPQGGRLEAIAALRRDLPALEEIFVIGDTMPAGMRPLRELLDQAPLATLPRLDPDGIAAMAFTSGTTSVPKGVVHTHRSICCEVWLHMDRGAPRIRRPSLQGGPIAHVTGMLAGLFLPPLRGRPVHLVDGWDPTMVLATMRECDLSVGAGAPVFMNSLFAHPDTRPEDLAQIEAIGAGGATIPIPFAERCEANGIKIARMYGSTEHPTITGVALSDPYEKRTRTDGRVLPGAEIRILDEEGRDVAPGNPGHIVSRGPDLCAGYIDPAMNEEGFDREGWFQTGDIGILDEDGFLAITDRRKDIIVRNGVKIGAVEVENVLLQMPALLEVAVVAAPDARTGERSHAFLRLRPGALAPTLDEVKAHFDRAQIARQKWPESLEIVDDFPRTPAGKVKKFELRERLRGPARS